jgi:hypothetical protein
VTTLTSLAADVTDYLVAQCQASTSLGAAAPPVEVFDGPNITTDAFVGTQRLWIGHDPFSTGQPTMEADQDFATMGDQARTRNETGHVVCAAEDASGDLAMGTHRDAVKALIGAVELMFRGLPSSGGPGDFSMGGLVLWASVTGPFAWYQDQLETGASASCVFRVSYFGRLTT